MLWEQLSLLEISIFTLKIDFRDFQWDKSILTIRTDLQNSEITKEFKRSFFKIIIYYKKDIFPLNQVTCVHLLFVDYKALFQKSVWF